MVVSKRKWGNETEEIVEEIRMPSTKGWKEAQTRREALPIKKGAKVIKTYRVHDDGAEKREESEDSDDEENGKDEEEGDGEEEESSDDDEESGGDGEEDKQDEDDKEKPEETQGGESYLPKESKKDAEREAAKRAAKTPLITDDTPLSDVRSYIAYVCRSITASPRMGLKRRTLAESAQVKLSTENTVEPNIADLFECMRSERRDCAELATLSALLVFKDIAPDYRIKAKDGNDHKLKKETKKQRDFERALLHSYQQYLHILERWVVKGLGSHRGSVTKWHDLATFGLSALRCECELIRALPHFNFRSTLLKTIISRAAMPDPTVAELCQGTLRKIFEDDVGGELTYEAICLIGTFLKEVNYKVKPAYIECLHSTKLTTRADQGSNAKKLIKRIRRKKRRETDGIEAGIAESDARNIDRYRQKFQVDTLQEVAIIYFRIIKRKVGTLLIPAALAGLGHITHLVNLETIEDLLAVLKSMVDSATLMSEANVRVLCILCAMRTLTGPGRELEFDPTIFIEATRDVLSDLPAGFDDWPSVLECVQLGLLGRFNVSRHTIETIVLFLLSHAAHHESLVAATIVSLTHQVLLRNPSLRLDQRIFRYNDGLNDLSADADDVGDMAMEVFRHQTDGSVSRLPTGMDGTWVLPLLLRQQHSALHKRVNILASRDVKPVSMRVLDAVLPKPEDYVRAMMQNMNTIPTSLLARPAARNGSAAGDGENYLQEKMSKKQKNKLKKLAKENRDRAKA